MHVHPRSHLTTLETAGVVTSGPDKTIRGEAAAPLARVLHCKYPNIGAAQVRLREEQARRQRASAKKNDPVSRGKMDDTEANTVQKTSPVKYAKNLGGERTSDENK